MTEFVLSNILLQLCLFFQPSIIPTACSLTPAYLLFPVFLPRFPEHRAQAFTFLSPSYDGVHTSWRTCLEFPGALFAELGLKVEQFTIPPVEIAREEAIDVINNFKWTGQCVCCQKLSGDPDIQPSRKLRLVLWGYVSDYGSFPLLLQLVLSKK